MDPRAGQRLHHAPRKFFASVRERLVAFAAFQFRLSRRTPDGLTERDHLEAAAKRGDKRAQAELAGPVLPAGAEYLWGWFHALDAARGGSGLGLNPISFSELDAFACVQGIAMSALEADVIIALDRKRLQVMAEEERRRHGRAQG